MCEHCEKYVRTELEALDGVASAGADHKAGTAVVTLAQGVSDETLAAAVEKAGYKMRGIEGGAPAPAENAAPVQKTLRIEGMMCEHCEKYVRTELEALDGVASAVADHKAGTAVVTLTQDVSEETLAAAIEKAGYKMLGAE